MSCSDCIQANPINYCSGTLEIGTLTAETLYIAEFTNTATDRTDIIEGTTDGAGLLTLDITELQPATNLSYELRLYDENGEPVNWTIGSDTYCCIQVKFIKHSNPQNKISLTVCSTT